MKLENMENFIDYVRTRLGYPVVNIELADDQIKLIVEDVVGTPPWQVVYKDKRDEVVERAYELWERILNKYPEARKNLSILNGDDKYHYVLSKEHPNVFFIDCGRMPRVKAEEHVSKVMNETREVAGEEYKIIFFPRFK